MAIQQINIGAAPNDKTGDKARDWAQKTNANFTNPDHAASKIMATPTQALAGTPGVIPDAEQVRKNHVAQVATIAALRALEPAGRQVELLGHTIAGVGGGVFYHDAASVAADDNGITIVTAGGSRWVRKLDGYVTPDMFGAIPDDSTDAHAAFASAILTGETVKYSGKFYSSLGLSVSASGQKIISDNPDNSYIRFPAGIVGLSVIAWYVELKNVYILGGLNGIEIGSISVKSNFAVLDNCHCKSQSGTGLKVINGNVGRIIGGMYESSDINIHFTADTIDTNGWTILGPRTFGGRINVWFQGDVNYSYVDDNFIWLTSEGYTEYGVILRGRRNICFLYTESTFEPTAIGLKVDCPAAYNQITKSGTNSIEGDFFGTQLGVSSVLFQKLPVSYLETELDATVSSKTDQGISDNQITTCINTSGASRNILAQKLDARKILNRQYYKIPATNSGSITLVLDSPVGSTFTDGTSSIELGRLSYDAVYELVKIGDLKFVLNVLSPTQATSENISISSSVNLFRSSYASGAMIKYTNTSGSTKNVTIQSTNKPGQVLHLSNNAAGSSLITLQLAGGLTWEDGTTTAKNMAVSKIYTITEVSPGVVNAVLLN